MQLTYIKLKKIDSTYLSQKAPIDTRKSLYEKIMISGGTSMFPGFPTRIENDMNRFYKNVILKGKEPTENAKVKINIIVINYLKSLKKHLFF